MSLKIVTGGTTGAADGTLESSSNKVAFTALDAAVDLHVRADDDTYTGDQTITVPTELQVSFDAGATWHGSGENPIPFVTGLGTIGTDIGDLNYPIKIRQHASAAPGSGAWTTDGTFAAATALSDVTGFTVTPGSSQNALSWSAVSNRTAYRIDRATDSGFTTGVALDISPGQTSTSFTDTGLTPGTVYYYRVKAVGTVRYKDSASYATGNGTPLYAYVAAVLADSPLVYLRLDEASGTSCADASGNSRTGTTVNTPTRNVTPGSGGVGNGKAVTLASASSQKITIPSASVFNGRTVFTLECWVKFTSLPAAGGGGFAWLVAKDHSWNFAFWNDAGPTPKLYCNPSHFGSGGGARTVSWSPSTGTWYHLVVTCDGTDTKFYVNGVQQGATQTLSVGTPDAGTSSDVEIGAINSGGYLDATVDEVAIFPTALSATRIAAHYAAR